MAKNLKSKKSEKKKQDASTVNKASKKAKTKSKNSSKSATTCTCGASSAIKVSSPVNEKVKLTKVNSAKKTAKSSKKSQASKLAIAIEKLSALQGRLFELPERYFPYSDSYKAIMPYEFMENKVEEILKEVYSATDKEPNGANSFPDFEAEGQLFEVKTAQRHRKKFMVGKSDLVIDSIANGDPKYLKTIYLTFEQEHDSENNTFVVTKFSWGRIYDYSAAKSVSGHKRYFPSASGGRSPEVWANNLCVFGGVPRKKVRETFKMVGLDVLPKNGPKPRYLY